MKTIKNTSRKIGINRLRLILIFILFKLILAAQENSIDWNFDNHYDNSRLFLHEMANYEKELEWQIENEDNQFFTNNLNLDFGSVSLNNLYNIIDLKINHKFADKWKFILNYLTDESKYKNLDIKFNYMGFERQLSSNFSLFSTCNTYYDKEDIDVEFGFMLNHKVKNNYLRSSLIWENFLYNKKNNLSGKINHLSLGLKWLGLYNLKNFRLYSEGFYSNRFSADYHDQSQQQTHSESKNNYALFKLYYIRLSDILQYKLNIYNFYTKEAFQDNELDYSYKNRIIDHTLNYKFQIFENIFCKPEFLYLVQTAKAFGFKKYEFVRKEFIKALYFHYDSRYFTIKIGYLRTDFNNDYDDRHSDNDYKKDISTQKLFIGIFADLSKNSRLLFSVSHEIRFHGFGGGNLQYQMFF